MGIRKYIPNTITSMNLLFGMLGVVAVFTGRMDCALYCMFFAAIFDFCDGLTARALGAYSDMGKELDSLSDVVSFGVLPSLMMVSTMRTYTFSDSWICFFPVLIAVFSGLRLAKFNIDPRQHDSFIGLPTPACALFCAALCYYVAMEPGSILATWAGGFVMMPAVTVVMCFLLVCEIPMFSIKFGHGTTSSRVLTIKRVSFLIIAMALIALVILMGTNWSLSICLVFAAYIVKNIIYAVFKI